MRDLAFDIRARDRTQQAFDAASRNARAFGRSVDQAGAGALSSARATDRMTQAVDRYGAAVRRASAANDNWQRNNLRLQLFDVGQMLALGQNPAMTLMQQGPQIAQIWGPEEGGVGRAFRETGKMITGVLTKFPLLTAAVAATGLGLAGMTYEINRVSDVTVGFGDVALATFQVIGSGIWQFIKPAVDMISPWFRAAWEGVIAGTKLVGNTIINSFRAAYADVKFVWSNFGDMMGAAVVGGVNIAIGAINWLIEKATAGIDRLIGMVNPLLEYAGMTGLEALSGSFSLPQMENPYADRFEKANAAHATNIKAIMSSDPLGEFFDAVKAQAVENALAGIEDKAGKAGKALKKAANDNKDPWAGLTDELGKINDALSTAGQSAGGLLRGLVDGTLDWRDALMQAGQIMLKLLNDMNRAQGGSGIFGGGFFQSFIGGLLGVGWAKGGAFDGGRVMPFASGGIVDRPTMFPMAKGAGLMGEAGPEAIMPLHRGADGKLGVRMAGARSESLRLEIVSRFDGDGGFNTAVERTSGPIAEAAAANAAGQVARAVPSMALGAMDSSRTRRTRTISPGGAL